MSRATSPSHLPSRRGKQSRLGDSWFRPSASVTSKSITQQFIKLPNNTTTSVQYILRDANVILPNGSRQTLNLYVTDLDVCDVILGKPWLTRYNPSIDWRRNTITLPHEDLPINAIPTNPLPPLMSHLALKQHARRMRRSRKYRQSNPLFIAYVRTADTSPQLRSLRGPEHLEDVLQEYQDVFPPDIPKRLPPKRSIDHSIQLVDGAQPAYRKPYRLSPVEKQELQRQISSLLSLGLIRPSKSPWGASVLFVPKKNGELRMCIDYRALNALTVKNRTMLPHTEDLLDATAGCTVFSKVDLRSAYHQIRLQPEDCEKTAFRTPTGHFEFAVLTFGLCNAPATFQTLMFNVLRPYLHLFVMVYLDDILIFSRSLDEHVQHVRKVLECLRCHQLFANREKSSFAQTEVEYLGYRLSKEGIQPCPDLVSSITKWPRPQSRTEVRSFLGLAGFYRRFFRNYAAVAKPLTDLTKTRQDFQWSEAASSAFEKLKSMLTTSPTLQPFHPNKPTRLVTDASDSCIGGCLQQNVADPTSKPDWRPVSFYSQRCTPAQVNYPVHDRELLALITALKKWRHYLFGTNLKITACTDHYAL